MTRAHGAVRVGVALVVVALALVLVWQQTAVRLIEARVAAGVADQFGVVSARSLRTAVVFPLEGRFVGFTLVAGCTAAFLVAPFLLIGAGLIGTGRIAISRGLTTLAAVGAVLFAVNQARLLVISGSMRLWGFETGYERSHVFLGTMVSTIGAIGGVLLFLTIATRRAAPSAPSPGRPRG